METNVKRREWVKTAAIIFLVVMLVLTFFSNTILNHSLPEVATANVTSGTINAKIRGSGTVSANETYDVTIKQTRKVASVKVRVGDSVSAGDVLMTLEAEESDELKQAQTELESMELSYEKSLIAASTEAARENRDVQKLREAYNDLLAQYNQYSTMDARQVELEKTKAEATLKELQKDLAKAQKELEKLKAEDEYVQAQADKTTYQTEYDACKKEIDEYTAQINELQSGKVIRSVSEIQAEINTTEQAQRALLKDYASRLAEHEAMYQEFSKLAGGREEIMDAYQADRDLLIRTLIEQGYGKTAPGNGTASGVDEAAVGATADAMVAAYKALKGYYAKAAALEDKLAELNAELKIAQSTESTADALAKLNAKLTDANKRLKDADMKLNSAKRIVEGYEAEIEALEGKI